MKVWVAIGGWNHEGYAEPIGVFSSEQLARAAAQKADDRYDITEVYEYVIDAPAPGGKWKPERE